MRLVTDYKLKDLDSESAQRLELLSAENCEHEPYWVQRLASLEPAVLPYAKSGAVSGGASDYTSVPMRLPDDVSTFLEAPLEPGRRAGILLAAYGVLLARLSGNSSFDIGYSDYALQREVAGLDGYFATHLPLRLEIDCSQSFTETLTSVKEQVEFVRKHRTCTPDLFKRYPQVLKTEAESNFPLPVVVEIVDQLEDHKVLTGSEITLLLTEDGGECRWVYDRDRLADESVSKIISHFTTLLRGIADNPEQPIAYLPLLTEEEQHQLVIEWNNTRTAYPKDACVQQLFEAQAARTPEAVALIFGQHRLTYRALNRRANQLAHYLQSLGVGPEVLVGICVARSVEMIVGILGILKAGGAYVPLDPAYPKQHLAFMLQDSQAPVLLTQQKLAAGFNEDQQRVVRLDTDWKRIARGPESNPTSRVAPNNLAYVIYTSGSTGKPKGVAIEHRSTVAFLHWATSVFTPEQLKGVLASTSICFDLSVFEMFAPLSCGGAVVLAENVLHLPLLPAANEVTLINTVPSAITELLRMKGVPASVRTVNLAGEPLKTALVRQIYELGTVKEVFDLYGPTEDTTYSTFTLRDARQATIGRPIANTQAYILDRRLQLVPAGVPGELHLGGAGLARGYLNRPELTAERFIANPFSQEPQARIYKTGDLARYLPSGEIEYLGRIDNQVKVRGYRIELGEIEVAISAFAAVRESVVIAREDQPGEKRLVAYLVPNQEHPVKINELRGYLRQELPDYMVPSAFVELDELPLTPNGKVDRAALPAPPSTLAAFDRAVVPNRDEVESQLTKIWEKTLALQPVGVTDNFFDLGGHSLQAVRMFAEVEKTFGKSIPLATLFQAATIEELAAILRQDGWSAPESSLVPIQPHGTKPPFFCIHAKGGNVIFYRDLARHLGADQPFYGLQARRVGRRQVGHSSVEEMADYYIKEIQKVQPEGPYFLGGASFGGLAAFEMAQQLQAQGHKVGLLALLDAGTPDYPKMLPGTTVLHSRVYRLVRIVEHHGESLRQLNSRERIEYVWNRVGKVRKRIRRKLNYKYKKVGGKFYLLLKQPLPKNFIQVENIIGQIGQRYVPRVYPGKVTLFRASNQPLGIYPDPTLGWDGLAAGGLEIHEVAGQHQSMFIDPHARTLAEELGRCLEKARVDAEQVQPTESSEPERSLAAVGG